MLAGEGNSQRAAFIALLGIEQLARFLRAHLSGGTALILRPGAAGVSILVRGLPIGGFGLAVARSRWLAGWLLPGWLLSRAWRFLAGRRLLPRGRRWLTGWLLPGRRL